MKTHRGLVEQGTDFEAMEAVAAIDAIAAKARSEIQAIQVLVQRNLRRVLEDVRQDRAA